MRHVGARHAAALGCGAEIARLHHRHKESDQVEIRTIVNHGSPFKAQVGGLSNAVGESSIGIIVLASLSPHDEYAV